MAAFTITFQTHERNGKHWAHITAWGLNTGRYGSQLGYTMALPAELTVDDPEEFLAELVKGLHGIVYHT